MQPLAGVSSLGTAYTAAQVYGFLKQSGTENYTFDWLGPDYQYRGDLTRYVTPDVVPKLTHDPNQAVPRSLSFQTHSLPAGLDSLADLVRAHFRLATPDGGWLDWTLATLLLNPPQKTISEGYTLSDFTATDLSSLFVDDEFLYTYTVMGGAYQDAVNTLLHSIAGPTIPFLGSLERYLPDSRSWDAGKTKLTAINDLLSSAAYRPLWFDEMGQARVTPLPDYNHELGSWSWDATAGQSVVVSSPFKESADPSNVVNFCRVLGEDSRNGKRPIVVDYENTRPDSPTSTTRYRGGRRKVKIVKDSAIADSQAAYQRARAEVQAGARVFSQFQLWTLAWPVWQNLDLVHHVYQSPAEGLVDFNYLVSAWTMDLVPGGLSQHTLQRVLPA